MAPHDGEQAGRDGDDGHHLRTHPPDRAFDDGVVEILGGGHGAFAQAALEDLVQIDDHHHAGFGRHARQGDEAHPHRHAQVVAQQVDQPDAAHQRERDREQHDHRFSHRVEIGVEQHHDDQQGQGHHVGQPFRSALHVLVLAAPEQVVAGRHLHLFLHHLLGFLDVAAQVAPGYVHEDVAHQFRIFALDGRGPHGHAHARQLGERNLGAGGGGDQDALEHLRFVAQLAGIAHVDGKALAPFDGAGDVLAADGGFDHVLDVAHREPIAGHGAAVDFEVVEVPAHHPLGVDVARAGDVLERPFHLFANFLDHLQVGAEDFDADRGADAGSQHVDAPLDGHGPGVGDAGNLQGGIHLIDELLRRHPGAPFAFRFEHDGVLHHGQRGRVGGGAGAARLAEDRFHLGKLHDDLVLELEHAPSFGNRHARQAGGHVEQRAFVKRRHELRAQFHVGRDGGQQSQQSQHQHRLGKAQRPVHEGVVGPDQEAVERVLALGRNLAADEQQHQHRHQRDREQRSEEHGEGLGKRQRLEQAPFLRLQGEDRQEGDSDDEQGEEERLAHLLGGFDHDNVAAAGPAFVFPLLQAFVGVLDHHDGGVHHGADGDGDAGQRHDVGIEADVIHRHQRHQDGDGEHENHHQRAAEVEEEDNAHQADNDDLFNQFFLQRIDGAQNQLRAVVHRHQHDALRK